MQKYKVQFQLMTEYTTFFGEELIMDEVDYIRLKETSKNFFEYKSFELTSSDGSFLVFPPEIIRKSVLKIYTRKITETERKNDI